MRRALSFSGLAIWLAACSHTPLASVDPKPTTDSSTNILLIGDSGYIDKPEGKSGLTPVAKAMKSVCLRENCDFAVMAGDNIYPDGADGRPGSNADADRFYKAFEKPFGDFGAIGPDFKIYMALGNHDWRTSRAGAQAQMDYAASHPPLFMNGPFYKITRNTAQGDIDLFVIDTEMLLSEHTLDDYKIGKEGKPYLTGKKRPGGKHTAKPISDAEKAQFDWFKTEIKRSTAKWKVVLAHHPLWESNGGKHEELVVLRPLLRPTVCQYADVYLAGHQHTLEIQEDNCRDISPKRNRPLLHVISGASSKARSVSTSFMNWQAKEYPHMTTVFALGDHWGFMRLRVENASLSLDVYAMPEGLGYDDRPDLVKQITVK